MPTWRTAWDQALYGRNGFFRREAPAAHFRTSVHASGLFAEALVRLARDAGLDTVVDIGAGRGELLVRAHSIDPALRLLGIEVGARPSGLPETIGWSTVLPDRIEGLVVANEWLDNIACHVLEVDPAGVPTVVHVDPATGEELLGVGVSDPSVPAEVAAWCDRWWPLADALPGSRVEVGASRDAAWADVVRRLRDGVAVAVDYGHLSGGRPPLGSLRSYQRGREVDVLPDGSRDVTAHVAVDAVAQACGASLLTQREALMALRVSGRRPDLGYAARDPGGYLRELSLATEAAELTATGSLGDFFWVVSCTSGTGPPLLRA
jgi:SAM-dependent MidA family methyltransferase